MKRIKNLTITIAIFTIFGMQSTTAQVLISGSYGTPDASSMLEISSTTGGILIPRMTMAERDLIDVTGSPTGVIIYQTDNTPGFYYYDGSAWETFGGNVGWATTGNAGTTAGTNFMGTTDDEDVVFSVYADGSNDVEVMRLSGEDDANIGCVGIGTATPDNLLDMYKTVSNESVTLFQAEVNTTNFRAANEIIVAEFNVDSDDTDGYGLAYGIRTDVNTGTSTSGMSGGRAYGVDANAEATTTTYGVRATAITYENSAMNGATNSYGGYFKGELPNVADGSADNVNSYGVYAEGENGRDFSQAYGIYAKGHGGASSYGGYFEGFSTNNSRTTYGLYATASGGLNNYAAIFDQGNVGINVTNPTEALQLGGTNAKIYMNSATSNMLYFNANGVLAPSAVGTSAGTKIVLYPSVGADYAIGIEGGVLWHSVPTTSDKYRFYTSNVNVAEIAHSGISTFNGLSLGSLNNTASDVAIQFYATNNSTLNFQLYRSSGANDEMTYSNLGTGEHNFYCNGSERFSIENSGNVTINGSYTLPNGDGSPGQVLTTNGSGTVSWVTNSTTKDVLDKSIAEQNTVIQEQDQIIETLQSEIEQLKTQVNKIDALQKEINEIKANINK